MAILVGHGGLGFGFVFVALEFSGVEGRFFWDLVWRGVGRGGVFWGLGFGRRVVADFYLLLKRVHGLMMGNYI
jgi:hypothetical protein